MNKTPGAGNATRRLDQPRRVLSGLTPATQFLCIGSGAWVGVFVLGGLLTGAMTGPGTLAAAAFFVLAMALGLMALRRGYPHPSIGMCNTVTIARLVIASALIAPLIVPSEAPWLVFGFAALALSLDGADGWLARREGYTSEFGAAFDMEVDAVLAMVLALLAFTSGSVGVWVILLGLPRYVFWIAQKLLPWLAAELPPRFSRKCVCVLQISALIVVLVPVLDRPLTDVLVGVAAGSLIWSFWVDVRWLWQARG